MPTQDEKELNYLYSLFSEAGNLHSSIHSIRLNLPALTEGMIPSLKTARIQIMDRAISMLESHRDEVIESAVHLYQNLKKREENGNGKSDS